MIKGQDGTWYLAVRTRKLTRAEEFIVFLRAGKTARSPLIGGATDLASTGKASQLLLRAKGRWASDIGAIYAR